jgi:antitoxin CptB
MNTFISSRLRWACRRGMLELDVLLGNFLAEAYSELTVTDQERFVNLLECNDQELFMWLTGKETATDTNLLIIIEKIRHHAKIRKHTASV